MTTHTDKAAPVPVFKKCVRCGYWLRGLPANHACPECGCATESLGKEDCDMGP